MRLTILSASVIACLSACGSGSGSAATSTGPSTPFVTIASIVVSPATVTVSVGNTVTLTATAKDAAGNVLTGRIFLWSSNATNRQAVGIDSQDTQTLTVTAYSQGVVTFQAYVGNVTGASVVTVVP